MNPEPVAHRSVLPNGVRVLAVQAPFNVVAVALYVRVGSRNESRGLGGITHFVEHMLFRGTKRFPSASALHDRFAELGASVSGRTSREWFCLEGIARPDQAVDLIDLMAEMLTNPAMVELEIERGILLDEIARYTDDYLTESLFDAWWPDHPFSGPIGGTEKSVRALSLESLQTHMSEHVVGSSILLVGCGPIALDGVLAAGKRLESLPAKASPAFARLPGKKPVPVLRTGDTGRWMDVSIVFPASADPQDESDADWLLSFLATQGLGSTVSRAAQLHAGMTYTCGGSNNFWSDGGLVSVDAVVKPGGLVELVKAIVPAFKNLKDQGPTPAELAGLKARLQTRTATLLDSQDELLDWWGEEISAPRSEPVSSWLTRVLSLCTTEGVKTCAQRVFRGETATLQVDGPADDRELEAARAELDEL